MTTALTVSAVAPAGAGAPAGGSGVAIRMMPAGGGYEAGTLQGFAREAARGASGRSIDLVVVPSAYGDALVDRPENIALARERTAEVEAACEAIVTAPLTGCTARLAILLDRKDAANPANSAALRDPGTDGIYLLGGDQGIAMRVLAGSPAERAITAAAKRGAVIGGTSAGAAVESVSMINGYVGDYGAAQGLRRGSTLMWWGDDGDRERGLVFGSAAAIYDQHFYQRGRFGRSLSTIAAADERFGGRSPVGVGVDYATSVTNTGDRRLTDVTGDSGAATIDFESLGATHRWVGTQRWLSARKVKVNLLTEGTAYDLTTRRLTRDGATVGAVTGRAWTAPSAPGRGALYLGGGVLGGPRVIPAVVKEAADAGAHPESARLLVLSADSASTGAEYGDRVKQAGWAGHIDLVTYGAPGWAGTDVTRYRAVLVVAVSPPGAARAMADPRFGAMVATAVRTAPVVLADGPAAAYAGTRWSPNPRPDGDDYEDRAVAAFKTGEARWRAGLALVPAAVVPAINTDYQWGRLFNAVATARSQLGLGISAGTAIRFQGGEARVVDGSVVVADGRDATTWSSRNGTLGAGGIVLDVFGPGERLAR